MGIIAGNDWQQLDPHTGTCCKQHSGCCSRYLAVIPMQKATVLSQFLPVPLAVCCLAAQVPAGWLSNYCSAACDVMPAMSSQQLTMCLWGLACAGATPHKAFVLLWFLSSIGLMGQATTQVGDGWWV